MCTFCVHACICAFVSEHAAFVHSSVSMHTYLHVFVFCVRASMLACVVYVCAQALVCVSM